MTRVEESACASAHGEEPLFEEPLRLLVADDDPILREFACLHLASETVTVEVAANGEAALSCLRAAPFDLALVDLDMPVMDGFGLIRAIRADAALQHLPVVVITGREDMIAIDRAFAIGATSFVVKPLNWRLLFHSLRYVLRASRQESEVRAAKARAEQALAFKANVLRLVQHELRTPLTSIIGFADQIAQEPKSPKAAEFARLISQAGRAFATDVSELISAAEILTQAVSPRWDDCRAASILEGALRAEKPLADAKGMAVRAVDLTAGAVFECDRALMVRALQRLIRNAIQHGCPPVEVMATQERDGAMSFVVRDGGAGIAPERLASYLEPFQQKESALARGVGGVGLGLPVAKRIMEAHGGALSVQSHAELGCLALLRLPPPARSQSIQVAAR